MATLLIIIALLALAISKLIKITNYLSTDETRYHDYKLIPADIVILSTSINIGSSLNPNSAFRLIQDQSIRYISAIILVLFSILIYGVLISVINHLHKRNRDVPFCAGVDRKKQIGTILAGVFFLTITIVIATI